MQTEQKDQRQVDIESMFVDPMKKEHGIAWELAYLLELLEEDKRQKSVPNSS